MSADLHIHAAGDTVTTEDMRCFSCDTLGSKYFAMFGGNRCTSGDDPWYDCRHRKAVTGSDSVWAGEVSWLKAMLSEDDSFIPEPVQAVQDAIGEDLPILDAALREKILRALTIPNERAARYDTTKDEGIVRWLDEHMGQRLFTVSW